MRVRPHGYRIAMLAASSTMALLSPSCGGDRSVTSTPSPTLPNPSPTASPAAYACPLGQGTVDVACFPEGPQMASQIEAAIDMVIAENPQVLDLTTETWPGSGRYRVVDQEAYLDAVVEKLRRQGLCAERDSDDVGAKRILVKDSNDYSERFDVLTEYGFTRRGPTAYVTTCVPASFPVARTSDMPPVGSGCYPPYPPPVTRFDCKVHLRSIECYTVDATPIVGPNQAYCAQAGFFDGRTLCPVRPEGAEDRAACEGWRVGIAKDTGRPGPTWTNAEGQWCTGPESNCQNKDSQYQVCVFRSGTVRATAENGASCAVVVER